MQDGNPALLRSGCSRWGHQQLAQGVCRSSESSQLCYRADQAEKSLYLQIHEVGVSETDDLWCIRLYIIWLWSSWDPFWSDSDILISYLFIVSLSVCYIRFYTGAKNMHRDADKVSTCFKCFMEVVFKTEFISKLDMIWLGEKKNKTCSIVQSIFQDRWSLCPSIKLLPMHQSLTMNNMRCHAKL